MNRVSIFVKIRQWQMTREQQSAEGVVLPVRQNHKLDFLNY